MKKYIMILAAAIAGIAVLSGCEEVKIKESKLPDAAQTFIRQYFPDKEVVFAEKERDNGTTQYNVRLGDGTEIDFDADGNWTGVDCEYSLLPDGILPAAIGEYIAANYPDAKAYKVEKEYGNYEVGITTGGLALVFNADGQFIRESK